jgi:hypothetical protein
MGIFLVISLIAFLGPFGETKWRGRRPCLLTVRVTSIDGNPIAGAQVRVFQEEREDSASVSVTNSEGVARMSAVIPAFGSTSGLANKGYLDFSRHVVQVSVANRPVLQRQLSDFTGNTCEIDGQPIQTITIRVTR